MTYASKFSSQYIVLQLCRI